VHSTFDYRPKRGTADYRPVHATTRRFLSHQRLHGSALNSSASQRARTPGASDLQAIEHSAMAGRLIALQVANEEATLQGNSWPNDKNIRFHVAAKQSTVPVHELAAERPNFTSDALAELCDEGVEAVRRRIVDALEGAIKARRDSERAESTVLHSLRDMPHMDEDSKTLALQLLMRCHRGGERLREALFTLEKEAAQAQSVYACDRRVLATRLVAQREATGTVLCRELAEVESKGNLSLTALLGRLRETDHKRTCEAHAAEAELRELNQTLETTMLRLRAEVDGRAADRMHDDASIKRLEGENQRLGAELTLSQQQHQTDETTLRAQIAILETEAEVARASHQKQLQELQEQRRLDELAHTRQLEEVQKLADRRQFALDRSASANEKEYNRLETVLARKMRAVEQAKEVEVKKLNARVNKLEGLLLVARRQKSNGG